MKIEESIKGFFVTEKDFEKNLINRIRYYYLQGFRVRKPATHRNEIIYPKGKHRKENIDEEILTLSYQVLNRWRLIEEFHVGSGKATIKKSQRDVGTK